MTTALRRLVTEFYPPAPLAPPIRRELRRDARAVAVRLAMRRLRARRRKQGLTGAGTQRKPMGRPKQTRL